MGSSSAHPALPDRRAARRLFDRAAATFEDAAFVHDEARQRLLARLDFVKVAETGTVVDLGAGRGAGTTALAARFPGARILAVDTSPAMLAGVAADGVHLLAADAERLALADDSAALVLANLILPWCDPQAFFAEAARVLEREGVLLFSTFGPDTLAELGAAFAAADDEIHVHGFFDMHDLGDLALRSGLEEAVMDVDRIDVTYADLAAIVRDLRACGATNVAHGRRRGLTGRARWAAFERAFERLRHDGRIGVTIELILGQAFGPGRPRGPRTEVGVPVTAIRRGRRQWGKP